MVIIQLTGEQLSRLIQEAVHRAINEDKQWPSSKSLNNQPLTIQEAAKFLNLAIPTLYSMVSRKEIPFSKPPGTKRLYFQKEALENWVKSGRDKTASEIELENPALLLTKKKKV